VAVAVTAMVMVTVTVAVNKYLLLYRNRAIRKPPPRKSGGLTSNTMQHMKRLHCLRDLGNCMKRSQSVLSAMCGLERDRSGVVFLVGASISTAPIHWCAV
jgi:hypothetical protein